MTPETTQALGAAATLYGLGGALSVLLQARQMHVRGTSGDVSARFLTVYVGGFAVWLLYGLGIGSIPIILVHAVGLVCGTVTLVVVLKLRGPAAPSGKTRLAGEDRARVRPVARGEPADARPDALRTRRGEVQRPETEPTRSAHLGGRKGRRWIVSRFRPGCAVHRRVLVGIGQLREDGARLRGHRYRTEVTERGESHDDVTGNRHE